MSETAQNPKAKNQQAKDSPAKPKSAPERLYIYNLNDTFLSTLQPIFFRVDGSVADAPPSGTPDTQQPAQPAQPATAVPTVPTEESEALSTIAEIPVAFPKAIKECTQCGIKFSQTTDKSAYRAHFKSQLHRYNTKRRLDGLDSVTEEEFSALTAQLKHASLESETEASGDSDGNSDGNSEVETSDSSQDSDEKLGSLLAREIEKDRSALAQENDDYASPLLSNTPYILFRSSLLPSHKCFGIFKTLFSKQDLSDLLGALRAKQAKQTGHSVLLMIGGGHFAGAIVSHTPSKDPANPVTFIAHKTFHRYTTRRKQGGSQSASDNAHGKAKSAGSSLRRYNEAALTKDVQALLDSWRALINTADSIYVRANGATNKKVLMGYDGAPIGVSDPRVNGFPFTTSRPTTSELKRAWTVLTHVTTLDTPARAKKTLHQRQKEAQEAQAAAAAAAAAAAGTAGKAGNTKQAAPAVSQNEEHTAQFVKLCKRNKTAPLVLYFKKHRLDPNFLLEPASIYGDHTTPLMYAAAHGSPYIITPLLVTLRANPELRNEQGRTAYELCRGLENQYAFRQARQELGEAAWDWAAAQVGPGMTREEAERLLKQAQGEEAAKQQREAEEAKQLLQKEMKRALQEEEAKQKAEYEKMRFKDRGVVGSPASAASLGPSVNMAGLSDEMRMRLMREQRARAAEARLKSQGR